jgi:hypothetical protein
MIWENCGAIFTSYSLGALRGEDFPLMITWVLVLGNRGSGMYRFILKWRLAGYGRGLEIFV